MDAEFAPIRKSGRQVGAERILQEVVEPPQFEIYPVSKRRKTGGASEFPFAVINYPCLGAATPRGVGSDLFYEQLEFKKFRYYLLDSVVGKVIDFLPGLNRVSEVVYKLAVHTLDKLDTAGSSSSSGSRGGLSRSFQLRVPAPRRGAVPVIDRAIVVFDTVCSSSYNLLVLKLPTSQWRMDARFVGDLVRLLKFAYPQIEALCKKKRVPQLGSGRGVDSLVQLLGELNKVRPPGAKKVYLYVALLKPDDTLEKLTGVPELKVVVLATTTRENKEKGTGTGGTGGSNRTIDITSLGRFDITKLYLDIFHVLKPRQGVSADLIQRWNDAVRLQVPRQTESGSVAGAFFHRFLLSYTIGGLGYNFIYYIENILNEARDANTLFEKLHLHTSK